MHPETGAEAAAAVAAGHLPTNPEMLKFTNVVFHHVPDALAPSVLASILCFTFCAGIVFMDLANNVRYDFLLMKRSTWREPVKLFNRLAYILARYGAFVFLFLTVYFINKPGLDCGAFARAINILWLIPLVFVDLIFLQRTLVVYSWPPVLTSVLGLLYVGYVAICAYCIAQFGFGYQVPLSDFCGYQVDEFTEPHATLFIVFFVVLLIFDTVLLLLTVHRLVEGGLAAAPALIFGSRNTASSGSRKQFEEGSLSELLLRQGVVYYVVVEMSRIAFIIVYYSVSNATSYQTLIAAFIVTIGPVMAGMLFRQTTSAVRRTTYGRSSGMHVDSHRGSEGTRSGAIRQSALLQPSPLSPSTNPADMTESPSEPYKFNATPSARRRSSLALEAGDAQTRSDDDEGRYGPGGFFNRARHSLQARASSRDSAMTNEKRSTSFATGTDGTELTLPKSTDTEEKAGDNDEDITSVPHLYGDGQLQSSNESTPETTPESIHSPLAPAERHLHGRRPNSRSRRVHVPAPMPAPRFFQALPQPPTESEADTPSRANGAGERPHTS